jgi:hypothetical protein
LMITPVRINGSTRFATLKTLNIARL